MVLGPLQYVPPPHTFFAASGPPPHEGPHLDLALSSPNPVVALLQASFDLRHATLRALSEALDIRLDRTGLGSLEEKPWTRIHPMRVRVWGARESTFTDDTARAEVPPLRASPTLVQLYELVAMLIEGFRFTIMRVLPNMPESIADGGDESMYAYVFERCPMMRIYEGALDGLSELEQRGLTMYALRRLLALECVGFYAFPLFYLFDPEAADFRIFDGIKAMPADDALARIEMSLCYLKAMVAQGAFDLWDQHGPCAREWWPYYRDYCGFEEVPSSPIDEDLLTRN
ncbi:hypothetical protein PsYK624_013180 [Phanerochaete sordida]|uniref:Uncharacterized protein n=1 Tax=Phanerochaete sordida TaxID=48140 RepID=A0A9P3L7Q8_9APHY|nr:hypothetical protein PsYK624_013180 [Phanerochaete sordida]